MCSTVAGHRITWYRDTFGVAVVSLKWVPAQKHFRLYLSFQCHVVLSHQQKAFFKNMLCVLWSLFSVTVTIVSGHTDAWDRDPCKGVWLCSRSYQSIEGKEPRAIPEHCLSTLQRHEIPAKLFLQRAGIDSLLVCWNPFGFAGICVLMPSAQFMCCNSLSWALLLLFLIFVYVLVGLGVGGVVVTRKVRVSVMI